MIDTFFMLSGSLVLTMGFLFKETFNPPKTEDDNLPDLTGEPGPETVIILRFIASIFLHFMLLDEYKQGLNIMKYSINHHYKFDSWWLAYLIGFMQFSMNALVELFSILSLIQDIVHREIILNFVAFKILVELDDYFFQTF